MIENSLFVLAGYDKETNQILDTYQESINVAGFASQMTKGLPHHITLGSFAVEKQQELLTLLNTIEATTTSFNVSFNHFGIFGGAKVLFIAPDSNHNLLCLKEVFGDSFNWTPHTTMLISEPKAIYEATQILGQHFQKFIGKVNCLYLYEFNPTRLVKKVILK